MKHRLTHRRSLLADPVRSPHRSPFHKVRRFAPRLAPRRAARLVLNPTGPTFRQVVSLFNKYYKEALALEKKLNPPSRFKTYGTPEEHRRQLESDLERAYGDAAMAARASKTSYSAQNQKTIAAPLTNRIPPSSSRPISREEPPPLARMLHRFFGMP